MGLITGKREIEAFRLKAVRQAIGLEARGMRHSGRNVTPLWRKHFGLSARASHATVIAHIDGLIAELERGA